MTADKAAFSLGGIFYACIVGSILRCYFTKLASFHMRQPECTVCPVHNLIVRLAAAHDNQSVIFGFDLEIGFRMCADGADFGGLLADVDVSAVAALPTVFADALPDFSRADAL